MGQFALLDLLGHLLNLEVAESVGAVDHVFLLGTLRCRDRESCCSTRSHNQATDDRRRADEPRHELLRLQLLREAHAIDMAEDMVTGPARRA